MAGTLERLDETWDKVKWQGFPVKKRKKWVKKQVIGLDSEAYAGRGVYNGYALNYSKNSGAPFMFCASDAQGEWTRTWTASQVREMIDELSRMDADIFVFNLTYETGAILRALHVTSRELNAIRASRGEEWVPIKGGAWEVKVYSGKSFQIRRNRNRGHKVLTLWDAHNFFPGSLDKVAGDLLGERKLAQDVTKYTPEYVRRHWNEIEEYCTRDAMLTARLMTVLLDKIEDVLGVRPQRHYSPATWAAEVFRALGPVENVWKFWQTSEGREVLRFAWGAYAGGKFEMRVKGYVEKAYQYDLSSAYPAVIAQLKSLRWAKVVDSELYHPEAEYGLIHCLIAIDPKKLGDLPHPVGVWGAPFGESNNIFDRRKKGTMYYPVGAWEAIITKDEYEYLQNAGADVKIVRGIWIYPRAEHELYRERVEKLYQMKEAAQDPWTRHVVKIILNGMYGKFVQVLRHRDGTLEPGLYWNPIHGGVITARVRCWVSEIQRRFGSHILAVHTDSVVSDTPLPIKSPGLGGWRFERSGEYIGIRSGVYQLGDKVAHQGFIPLVKEGERLRKSTWKEILQRANPNATHVQLEQEEVVSWIMAGLIADPQSINVFARLQKTLSLADDPKRVPVGRITAGRLLRERIETLPQIVFRGDTLLTGMGE